MAEHGQVRRGWLVIDEQGAITHAHGEIPGGMIAESGRLSDAILRYSDPHGSTTLLDVLASMRDSAPAGTNPATDSREWRGTEMQFTWKECSLTAVTGDRSVFLLLQHPSREPAPKAPNERCCDTFERSPVGMYRKAVNGSYLEVNSALAALYGHLAPENMVEDLQNLGRQLYVQPGRHVEFLEIMRTQGSVRDFQSEIYRADGSVIWITEFARAVDDPAGNVRYYEGAVFDISHQKVAEHELSASREQFRRLVESVSVVPWEAEAETGRVRYVGPQAEQLLAFPINDWFRPGFWSERLHPMDRDWVEIVRDDAIRNLGRFESEYRLLNARDEIVWVRDIVSVSETSNGERILGGFLHNITHRRAAEEALRQNQDFIEQIANACPLIWYVLDLDTERPIYLNGGGIRILGFAKDTLLKMEQAFFLQLGHPADMEDHRKHFQHLRAIRNGEYLNREFRLRTAEGRWVWVRTHEVALRSSNDGRVHQVVGTAEDVTLRKAALENLAKSEALFRRLAETTNVIPFELDLVTHRFTYIGPQAAAMFGFQPGEWLDGDFWSKVIHPTDRDQVEQNLRGLMDKPDAHAEFEMRLRDSNGEYRWVRQVLRSELVCENELIGRGFLLDISAAKSIEAEREHSRHQLRELALQNQRSREEERLAMSRELHDELGQALTLLRIDLTWIASRISRCDEGGIEISVKDKIGEMESDIGKTLQIVRRITTELRPPVLDELGLADAIEWQVRDFSRRVGIRCDVSAESVRCECKTTATAAFRTLQELLTNVARHSKASRVRVFLKEAAGALTLAVADNGCGFDVGASGPHAGFGLLGMRERAESLHGALHIESKVGAGTTVTLSVPTGESTESDGRY